MNEGALILVVDDNDRDAWLLQMAFHRAGVENPVEVLCGGPEAIAYLSRMGPVAGREAFRRPEGIFIDLNMPQTDGMELLKWMKANPALANIPVIVLLSSEEMDDMDKAYAAGAQRALFKPVNYDLFVEEIRWVWEDVLSSRSH